MKVIIYFENSVKKEICNVDNVDFNRMFDEITIYRNDKVIARFFLRCISGYELVAKGYELVAKEN